MPRGHGTVRLHTTNSRLLSKVPESEKFPQEANSSTIPTAMILDGRSDGRRTCIEKIGLQNKCIMLVPNH
jgi:hypothetical protein